MKPRACASCGRRARVFTKMLVVQPDASLRSGMVCPRCSEGSIRIAVPPPVTTPIACSSCGREPAAIGLKCAERLGANVRELAGLLAARVQS